MPEALKRLSASSIAAVVFLAVLVFLALVGSHLGFQDPDLQDYAVTLAPPSWEHLLGTDDVGRDTLARIISASRVSVVAVTQAVAIAVVFGVPLGTVAGLYAGTTDQLLSRLFDAILSFPPLILAVGIVGVLGPSLFNAMTAIGVVFIPVLYRVTRAATMVVMQEGYIEAAKVSGASSWFLARRHVLRNILPPVVTQVCLLAGTAMIAEASLSFIGLGVQPPQASWGSMLAQAARSMNSDGLWFIVFPGLAIAFTSLAFITIGDGLREMAQSRHSMKSVGSNA